MAGVLVAAPAAAQTTDTVFVELRGDTAHVRQHLMPEGGVVRAFAMRFEGQDVSGARVAGVAEFRAGVSAGGPPEWTPVVPVPADGAYRIEAASAEPLVLSYAVSRAAGAAVAGAGGRGATTPYVPPDRIPLFVAGGRAEQTVAREVAEPWLVRVEADPAALDRLDLSTSLPRFARTSDGAVTATLSSVPGLLRLSRGGPLSFARVADLVVLALLLAAATWTWRNARVRREDGGSGT